MSTTNDMALLLPQALSPAIPLLLLLPTPNLTQISLPNKMLTAGLRLVPQISDYPTLLPFGMHVVL